jgi:hypothetical protein
VLEQEATVVRNASEQGGGIAAHHVVMTGAASVRRNTAIGAAGGIRVYRGTITMHDTTRVMRNEAGRGGGMLVAQGTALTLHDTSRVTLNRATRSGGGILVLTNSVIYSCSDGVAISPNVPDDPPATQPCP